MYPIHCTHVPRGVRTPNQSRLFCKSVGSNFSNGRLWRICQSRLIARKSHMPLRGIAGAFLRNRTCHFTERHVRFSHLPHVSPTPATFPQRKCKNRLALSKKYIYTDVTVSGCPAVLTSANMLIHKRLTRTTKVVPMLSSVYTFPTRHT